MQLSKIGNSPTPTARATLGAALTLVLLLLVTLLGTQQETWLGLPAISMLYLLCVLLAAYVCRGWFALLTALVAFVLINYFFIEPRFTWQVGSVQSWVQLFTFAIVALSVSTSIQQLRLSRLQAEKAQANSEFLQKLAETSARCDHTDSVWQQACHLISENLPWQAAIVTITDTQTLKVKAGDVQAFGMPAGAAIWALDYARPIGAGTTDWPDLACCVLPLTPLPGLLLLIRGTVHTHDMPFLRLIAHQLAETGQRLHQQQARLSAEQRAAEAEFKKLLLTTLSHDMRTPLTALLGAVTVLSDDSLQLDPSQRENLRASIQAESAFLSLATENILTMVKLETASPLTKQHMDWQSPVEIAGHVVHRYQQRIQSNIHIENVAGEALILGDAHLLAHALANVLDNACKYRTLGTTIAVRLAASEHEVELSVLNHGTGFPPDFKIARFHGRTQSHQQRGFGLGLMIVQQIMTAHHGRLQIGHDASGKTSVSMIFPRSQLQ